MSTDYIVRGDHLQVLNALAARQSDATVAPRALVWGVDLSREPTHRAARKHLRHASRDALEIAVSQPGLAHIFVAYSHGGALEAGACLGSASQTAARMHAGIERVQGRYVDVIAIDVTGSEDELLLVDRIREATAVPAGVAGDAALGWHEIVDVSIQSAAMRQLC